MAKKWWESWDGLAARMGIGGLFLLGIVETASRTKARPDKTDNIPGMAAEAEQGAKPPLGSPLHPEVAAQIIRQHLEAVGHPTTQPTQPTTRAATQPATQPATPQPVDNSMFHMNDAGLAILKDARCEKPPTKDKDGNYPPYQDDADVWTIGWGHTDGVTKDTKPVTETEADTLLRDDLKEAEDIVKANVKIQLNPNQFSAIASLVYNIGGGKFSNSSFLRRLNEGADSPELEALFIEWNKVADDVAGGLVYRRGLEWTLFETPVTPPQVQMALQPSAASTQPATQPAATQPAVSVAVAPRSGGRGR